MSNFIINQPLLMFMDTDDNNVNQYYKLTLKYMRDSNNPFTISDVRFIQLYRFPQHIVLNMLSELDVGQNEVENALPFHIKFLLALHFYGNGSYQKSICHNAFNAMSQPSACRAISEITNIINRKWLSKYIRFPTTALEMMKVKEGFFTKWRASGVIGAIDGTHIRITAPSTLDEEHQPQYYINRKGVHSINAMIICDSDGIILASGARHPGSCHDSAIWHVSEIKNFLNQNYRNGDHSSHLIGDSGYPQEPWLFTPIRGTIEPESVEHRYNVEHVKNRNVVERTIGVLKNRFRCLLGHRVLHYHPGKAARIFYACNALHNIATHNRLGSIPNEDFIEATDTDDDSEGEEEAQRVTSTEGMQARLNYLRSHF